MGFSAVVALNKSDIVNKKQTKIDEKILSEKLGCPVIKTISTSSGHEGLKETVNAAAALRGKGQKAPYVQGDIDFKDKTAVEAADRKRFEFVNGLIRTEEVGNMASKTSAYKMVRATLLDLQRDLAKTANILMDGRDIGTNVLPNADLKIYLTASSKVRAERRYKELVEKGVEADFDKIEEDIIIRDRQDMEREIAPLKQAEDAVLVDSSDMTIEEVVDAIVAEFEKVK